MDSNCPRCGSPGWCFCRGGAPAQAHTRDAWPPPIREGLVPGVQPCRTCGSPALYEWTFRRYQACSQVCAAKQGCIGEELRRAVEVARDIQRRNPVQTMQG